MVNDSSLSPSILVASFVVVSLFTYWYKKDPLVSPKLVTSLPLLTHLGGSQLDVIPTVGFSDPILSYFSALRFIFNGLPMLGRGYEKVCLRLHNWQPSPMLSRR
jgi:hypothetical protein